MPDGSSGQGTRHKKGTKEFESMARVPVLKSRRVLPVFSRPEARSKRPADNPFPFWLGQRDTGPCDRCRTRECFNIALSALAIRAALQLDVRGGAQVLPLSVGFHLREIILFHEADCVAAEQ
jgi:hypothetical protein